jgi:signal recognition particle receptor subunit beta
VVVVSHSGKEINAKLVYYGPGLSGKTTNLESIYEAVPDTSRGKMVSMKTQSDRTLFFDLLPLDLGEIMGFKTRFLLYTVPGQVFYNATRKLVLKGADAVVFVADSDPAKMAENQESLANLHTNLNEYGVKLEELAWVMQYNKRDLPNALSLEDLNAALNPDGKATTFEAVANQGKGVFETFRGVSHLLIERVTKDLRRAPLGGRGRRTSESSGKLDATTLASFVAPPATPAPAPVEPPAPAPEPASAIEFGRDITLEAQTEGATEPAHPPLLRRPDQAPTRGNSATIPAPPVRPGSLMPEPFLTGTHAAERPGITTTAPQAEAASGIEEVVVPVVLPRGATREIVLRIVISDAPPSE